VRTKGINNTSEIVNRVLASKSKELTPVISSIERLKALDSDFKASVEGIENDWLSEADRKLKELLDRACVLTEKMIKKLDEPSTNIESMVSTLNSFCKAISIIAEQHNLSRSRPTSITGHLHAHHYKIENLSDEEIDARIAEKLHAIGLKVVKVDNEKLIPAPVKESYEALDSDEDEDNEG
jgi:hypothetical protein